MRYKIAIPSQLASHIKSLRRLANLTQRQLGARLGLSQRTVAQFEARPERASFERVLTVLSALNADLSIQPRSESELTKRLEAPSAPYDTTEGVEADKW